LVPPLLGIVRSSNIPTVIRTSALSLLADCEHTHSLSMLPYGDGLFEAMIDLLQVETVPATLHGRRSENDTKGSAELTIESEPTSLNPKIPPLRRAALHFLLIGLRARLAQIRHSTVQGSSFSSLKRARTTLQYVSSTDKDTVVRVMAREAEEEIEQLYEAIAKM
jgi:hypothetical protein